MKRRDWLRRVGVLAGLGTSAVVGAGFALQPHRKRIVFADDKNKQQHLAGRTVQVAVVGGGIAGLTAGIELASRGYRVRLFEANQELGGKMATFRHRVASDEFDIEHGFHAFFDHYYNLNELLTRATALGGLLPGSGYDVVFRDRPTERYLPGSDPLLVRLASVVARSKSLKIKQFMDGLDPILAYESERTFRLHDNRAFTDFGRSIDSTVWQVLLEPFARQTMNNPAKLSMAEAIRFFQFYFFGNPEGLGFKLTRESLGKSVVTPLRALFEQLGGTVLVGRRITKIVQDGGKVVGICTNAASSTRRTKVTMGELPDGQVVKLNAEQMFLRRNGDDVIAFDARCTHGGCPVAFEEKSREFQCPCHGGRYDISGAVLAGPPPRSLRRLDVIREGGQVFVQHPTVASEGYFGCDRLIVATDPPATRQLLTSSALEKLAPQLEPADGYCVLRTFIDKPVAPGRSSFFQPSGYRPLDLIAIYNRLQPDFAAWSQKKSGSVIELHAYALAEESMANPHIRQEMWNAAQELMPEIQGAKIIDSTIQMQHNFARFAPGDDTQRPSTDTAVPNLKFAGDWVKLPVPASLMEAAAMSGRFAANSLMQEDGLARTEIPHVDPRGPLASVRKV